MRDFEKLMVAIYEGTVRANRLFVDDDDLRTSLCISNLAFSRILREIDRRKLLAEAVMQRQRLNTAGIEYVEQRLLRQAA
jgi:hypothetical protein